MTTKPKTRKPAAAKTVAPALKPYDYFEANREKFENDIPKLIARWHFLEADRRYHDALSIELGYGRH